MRPVDRLESARLEMGVIAYPKSLSPILASRIWLPHFEIIPIDGQISRPTGQYLAISASLGIPQSRQYFHLNLRHGLILQLFQDHFPLPYRFRKSVRHTM